MQKMTKKNVIAIGAGVIAIILVISIIRSCGKNSGDKFEFQEVSVGKVEKTISVTGVLDVSGKKTILSKTNGVISNVAVDFNQEVRKGQVLAEIDTSDLNQVLKKMGAQLESAKLELAIAEEDLESKKSMHRDNLISDKGLERAQYNYKSVLLKYRQFMVDYENTRTQKANARIVSPIDGIVLNIMAVEGAPIVINTPVFVLAPSLKKMSLTISIDESDIGIVKKNQNVTFSVSAFPEKIFRGKIDRVRINPVVKGGLVTYDSIVACDNDEQLLKPGMTATATIEINKLDRVIRIPNQALLVNPLEGQEELEKNTVWRKSDKLTGKIPAEKVKIDVGLRGDTYTEIKKNLKKGDKILIKYIRGTKAAGK
ncbi:MAG TPA: efflux RND transporter periplasmic adaptor subunit [Spirochaetota bacterium]|nr:efflux RND transporter periplasmic adaptor subunit [Spirochaetota bacterium]HPV40636.1 efflux RND transporter periplasmic adaptor subunit [Spirochaetota bacterium]